ncbi:MAG: dihydroneopterin aldolase [Bacteroidales bacterium]|nr:dihydroneopterin aldolase [Bacteroidales bacterium]
MSRTYIDIDGLQIYAHHGVGEQERRVGNRFEVSLRLYYDASDAVAVDDIAAAVNYGDVIETVKIVMSRSSALLEHVAGRIRDAVCTDYAAVTGGRVTVAKLHPPVSAQLSRVSFTLEW